MRFFAITFDKVIIRFYLMMATVFIGVFSGYYAVAVLALPIFLSAILGISFRAEAEEKKATSVVQLPASKPTRKSKVA